MSESILSLAPFAFWIIIKRYVEMHQRVPRL
jgi:hypothetical protein